MKYCIYFLVRDSKVTYIGHTKHIQMRVRGHSLHKIFDYVRWIPCDNKEDALYYEKRWQSKFLPPENINGTKPEKKKKQLSKRMVHLNPVVNINKHRVRVQFSIGKTEYDKAIEFAEKDGRTLGNYISWCIVRSIRNDSFSILNRFDNGSKMKLLKNG